MLKWATLRKLSCFAAITFTICGLWDLSQIQAARAERDVVRIVGSSTMYPYLARAAETFHLKTGQRAPVIEATGSVAGFKIFCDDVGLNSPDIVASSRRMTPLEEAHCLSNDVLQVAEFKIGYDGIVIARSQKAKAFSVTRATLWRALSRTVQYRGRYEANPYTKWSDIHPGFPNDKIRVYGPPMTSGTRDVFVHLVMNSGCESLPVKTDDFVVKDVCGHIREDGAYINAAEDDAMMVKRLIDDPNAIGIMGYGALKRHKGQIQGLPIEGVIPEDETLEYGHYPLSRPLYIYVKTAHSGRVKGLMDFVGQVLSDENIGFDGDLPQLGLIPMRDNEKYFVQSSYKALLKRLKK